MSEPSVEATAGGRVGGAAGEGGLREHTPWARQLGAPLRAFLRTESGSAGVLVAAIGVALVWANVDAGSYEAFWRTELAVRAGRFGVGEELRTWVNSGLMTIFFLVVGLEARREFDLGDLRERRRFVLPSVAGLVGMLVPVLIYLAFTAGGAGAHGWGVAMSTDTALALGLLALIGRNVPDQVRVFLLTVFVVDDLVALVVIAVVYSEDVSLMPLAVAVGAFAVFVALRSLGVRRSAVYVLVGFVLWAAMLESGVDPVVAGLAMGLTAVAYSPARESLEAASGLFKLFREQPTPEIARTAYIGVIESLSPNDRLTRRFHPWSSYVIVPLFGLANAGIVLDGAALARAYTSPVTWGVIAGYLVGKPVAVVGVSALLTWSTKGRVRPGVGWAAVLGSGTIAGIGFTVTLLIATLAFSGPQAAPELADAKIGVLSAALGASVLTWTVFRVVRLLPAPRRARLLLGNTEGLVDLIPDVDPGRDHCRGPVDASVTVVEYGDFQCPYCGRAEPAVRDLITDTDLRYVWRHLPLTDVHPQAQLAAEAAEAAAAQGRFWEMHDLLLDHQEQLRTVDLIRYAEQLGIDAERFHDELTARLHAGRVAEDVDSADLSGVAGTPTFFINGRRHYGAYDLATLKHEVKIARLRVSFQDKSV